MDSFIKKLWNNNKLLFLILLPIVVIWLFKDIFLKGIVLISNKELKKASDKDKDLSKSMQELKTKADEALNSSKQIESEIDKIQEDENWHKKK